MLEVSDVIIKIGFVIACLTNSFLIYLTAVHVTYIRGTYKYMIIIFATACIIFDASEVLGRPLIHNFNGGLFYISLNKSSRDEPLLQLFYAIFIDAYAGLYSCLIAFAAVQFIFRYATLLDNRALLKSFKGLRSLVWIPVIVIPGTMFCGTAMLLLQPDEYSNEYVREEVLNNYGRDVEDVARLILVAYDEDKEIRWKNASYCLIGTFIISLEYLPIIFCAVKMQMNIKSQLKNVSCRHRNLENQFFKALLVQICLPTFILTFPMAPMLLAPLLDTQISFDASAFYSVLSLYPSMDSLALMLIVAEYRGCVKKVFKRLLPAKIQQNELPLSSIS
ncbi:unnamed protein product [Caenorhabditis sp. 36 PRJEB53466]|nr:unnamed protein product [Caenorhabditis sp. 36 PRJEB53466]